MDNFNSIVFAHEN